MADRLPMTHLGPGYSRYAAPENIAVRLADAERLATMWRHRSDRLRQLLEIRIAEKTAGTWPYPPEQAAPSG